MDVDVWLELETAQIAAIVSKKCPTAVIYLNGTRRWFLTQSRDWAAYPELLGQADRALCQLLFDHGLQTLIKPLVGHDLLQRGPDYQEVAIRQGLVALNTYRAWLQEQQIRLSVYGDWVDTLNELGYGEVAALLTNLAQFTQTYPTRRRLLLGVFADREVDRLATLARGCATGEELLRRYYGQPVGPVQLIIGSGQPAIWDIPLLDFNAASLYFLQAPTYCLDAPTLRRILHDHLYRRVSDDDLYDDMTGWQDLKVLGLGERTQHGWVAT